MKVRLYFIDMLKALHYCHEIIHVIHRDIKPENIMIGHNEEAVLIDFGVSGVFNASGDLGKKLGTQLYFPPEVFEGAAFKT